MSLRCLLFSSNKETVQPIWQVLTELGAEGEYCESAVDAVEKVTTHLFQIVITDWDDQPEATFLLKTARDQKAAHRPLTLAIVSNDDRPKALQAGANSVLLKPIHTEQVRDTLSTAFQLLRARQQTSQPQPAPQPASPIPSAGVTPSAAAGAAPAMAPSAPPIPATQSPEPHFRAGEFLQSPNSLPSAQFDTETESEVQKSMQEAEVAEVDALTDLEPTAAAVEENVQQTPNAQQDPDPSSEPAQVQVKPHEPLSGWAALQARIAKAAPQPARSDSENTSLLSYGDTPLETKPSEESSLAARSAEARSPETRSAEKRSAEKRSETSAIDAPQPEAQDKNATPELSSAEHIAQEPQLAPKPAPRLAPSKISAAILLAACVCVAAVPKARQQLLTLSRSAIHAANTWLNPPPAQLPQTVAQHDSFAPAGDEYALPTPTNIPDATTDPSQIRVLPVVDPTAKPDKNANANSAAAVSENVNGATNASNPTPSPTPNGEPAAQTPVVVPANVAPNVIQTNGTSNAAQPSVVQPAVASPISTANAGTAASSQTPTISASPVPSVPAVTPPTPAPVRSSPPPTQSSLHAVSANTSAGIPSSLKSQLASSTPESSGAMPPEAAMSSIEPVNLPESAVRALLAQSVDPEYPAAAKASGLRGSVTVQVIIGRDGNVEDAKFLQGSLAFARSALAAVKQWRFKPYSMNGRAVSVQSVLTLTFQPPA